jgi:hypothetical protein
VTDAATARTVSGPAARTDAWAVLQQLMRGQAAAAAHLANTLRVEAHGCTTFGRTDAIDSFAARPLAFSNAAQVLLSRQDLAVIDDTADGRSIGAYADLVDGVIARLWVVGVTHVDAAPEPAVAVARDDFMSQLRQRCQGDAADHVELRAGDWPRVVAMADVALNAVQTLQQSPAASSSQVWVMRAFSSGDRLAALLRLRVQTATLPRTAHERLALAVAHVNALESNPDQNAHPQQRLAMSDSLPNRAPVTF